MDETRWAVEMMEMMEVESNIEVARGTSGASKEMEKGGRGGRHDGWGESQQVAEMGLGGESVKNWWHIKYECCRLLKKANMIDEAENMSEPQYR